MHGYTLDVFLASGDIVYVPNKTLRFGRKLIRLAIDTFINSFGTAAGSYYANRFWFPPPNTNSDNNNSTTTTTTTTTTPTGNNGTNSKRLYR